MKVFQRKKLWIFHPQGCWHLQETLWFAQQNADSPIPGAEKIIPESCSGLFMKQSRVPGGIYPLGPDRVQIRLGEAFGGGRRQRGRSGWSGSVAPSEVLTIAHQWSLSEGGLGGKVHAEKHAMLERPGTNPFVCLLPRDWVACEETFLRLVQRLADSTLKGDMDHRNRHA